MCEQALKLRTALDAVVFSETELHQYIITDKEWERVNLLVEVLQSFKDATVFMSLSEYPTLSMVVPLRVGMNRIQTMEICPISIVQISTTNAIFNWNFNATLADCYLKDALKKVEFRPGSEPNGFRKVVAVDIRSYAHVLEIIWDEENKKENIAIGIRYFCNGTVREAFITPKGEQKKLSTRYKDKVEANFAINSPQHMVFATDIYYPSKEDKKKGQPSVSAVCGSMNDNLTEFSCRYRMDEKLRHDVDIIENLNEMVLELFEQHKVKGRLLPEIIFYRDGVGETQFETVKTDELEPLLVALEKYYKSEKLPPLKLTFMIIQKRYHASLHNLVPLYHTLFDTLEETIRQNNTIEWLVQRCEAAKSKLTDYCHKTNVLHLAAIVLDPHLKLDYCGANKYESQYAPVATNQGSHSTEQPTKTKFARDCLPISAMSVPSEQIFSISSDMITDKQNRLSEKTVRAAMCLRSW
ncbi:Piwi domain-containing protein [Gigaspora rosea]|uniref:Piwi domain-containing protein n=1 Tax=Gigaspora rosea TaxID=44941 RepID=A0A397UVW1_9GLOM|nr:Piwi domain-containing protein [Gigaspora rosea]